MLVSHNSARGKQVKALRCSRLPALSFARILIANLELEFLLTSIRISELRFSNRKYSQVFHSPCRIASGSQSISNRSSNRNIRFTEKELSCTKQARKPDSNRSKITFSGNSNSHTFSRARSAVARHRQTAPASAPLSSAPNLAIIDFPSRGHL